jgi:hypothetical protein
MHRFVSAAAAAYDRNPVAEWRIGANDIIRVTSHTDQFRMGARQTIKRVGHKRIGCIDEHLHSCALLAYHYVTTLSLLRAGSHYCAGC